MTSLICCALSHPRRSCSARPGMAAWKPFRCMARGASGARARSLRRNMRGAKTLPASTAEWSAGCFPLSKLSRGNLCPAGINWSPRNDTALSLSLLSHWSDLYHLMGRTAVRPERQISGENMMLIFVGAWLLARGIAAIVFIALLPLGAILFLASQLLGTPNIEWLLDALTRFIKTPIV